MLRFQKFVCFYLFRHFSHISYFVFIIVLNDTECAAAARLLTEACTMEEKRFISIIC